MAEPLSASLFEFVLQQHNILSRLCHYDCLEGIAVLLEEFPERHFLWKRLVELFLVSDGATLASLSYFDNFKAAALARATRPDGPFVIHKTPELVWPEYEGLEGPTIAYRDIRLLYKALGLDWNRLYREYANTSKWVVSSHYNREARQREIISDYVEGTNQDRMAREYGPLFRFFLQKSMLLVTRLPTVYTLNIFGTTADLREVTHMIRHATPEAAVQYLQRIAPIRVPSEDDILFAAKRELCIWNAYLNARENLQYAFPQQYSELCELFGAHKGHRLMTYLQKRRNTDITAHLTNAFGETEMMVASSHPMMFEAYLRTRARPYRTAELKNNRDQTEQLVVFESGKSNLLAYISHSEMPTLAVNQRVETTPIQYTCMDEELCLKVIKGCSPDAAAGAMSDNYKTDLMAVMRESTLKVCKAYLKARTDLQRTAHMTNIACISELQHVIRRAPCLFTLYASKVDIRKTNHRHDRAKYSECMDALRLLPFSERVLYLNLRGKDLKRTEYFRDTEGRSEEDWAKLQGVIEFYQGNKRGWGNVGGLMWVNE